MDREHAATPEVGRRSLQPDQKMRTKHSTAMELLEAVAIVP
jgi:hypothetical protein